ncbi:hypothetical protein SAMN04488601_1011625 [Paenibacillus sp. 453mf]|nr:hypothetical protein SAMN04488601_1011625 [Paenibacillus sp. 453mf]
MIPVQSFAEEEQVSKSFHHKTHRQPCVHPVPVERRHHFRSYSKQGCPQEQNQGKNGNSFDAHKDITAEIKRKKLKKVMERNSAVSANCGICSPIMLSASQVIPNLTTNATTTPMAIWMDLAARFSAREVILLLLTAKKRTARARMQILLNKMQNLSDRILIKFMDVSICHSSDLFAKRRSIFLCKCSNSLL